MKCQRYNDLDSEPWGAVGVQPLIPRGHLGSHLERQHFLSSEKFNIEPGLVTKLKHETECSGAEAALLVCRMWTPCTTCPVHLYKNPDVDDAPRSGSRACQRADPHTLRQAVTTDKHHGRPRRLELAGHSWYGKNFSGVKLPLLKWQTTRHVIMGVRGRHCVL